MGVWREVVTKFQALPAARHQQWCRATAGQCWRGRADEALVNTGMPLPIVHVFQSEKRDSAEVYMAILKAMTTLKPLKLYPLNEQGRERGKLMQPCHGKRQ